MKTTRFRTRLLAALLYAAFLLVLCEGLARVALSSEQLFQRLAGRDEVSWRLRWTRGEAGVHTAFYDRIDIFDPSRGWALQPMLRGAHTVGQGLTSNAKGLRGMADVAYDRTEGIPRLLLLGDSFTFGEGVEDRHTYAAFLQQDLPGIEVLNLGVHGYGHDQMLVYYREEGRRYQADVVALGFVGQDMERNLCNFWHRAKPKFVVSAGRLKLTNSPVPTPDEVMQDARRRLACADLARLLVARVQWWRGAAARRMESVTASILDAWAEEVKADGGTPLLLYIPTPYERAGTEDAEGRYAAFFQRYCGMREVRHLDLRPYFDAYEAWGMTFVEQGHWKAAGHQAIARGLKDYLAREGLLVHSERFELPTL